MVKNKKKGSAIMLQKAKVILDKDYEIAPVDPKVFGSFVEPIGRCIYGGLYEPEHPKADENGFRTDVLELTRPLNLSINRFPGGNYTSTFRWEDGIGPKDQRPRRADVAWQSIEPNQFGINEFVDWSKANGGSDIMMTLNLATRGILEALDCVEYCNMKEGTYWSDMRIAHGYKEPHNFKYWCLTNEIDGSWQVGQTTGRRYGELARETSKAIKLLDLDIKTVLAGSSKNTLPTFPMFDFDALDESYEYIDYLSIHQYLSNIESDDLDYLAKPLSTNKFFKDTICVIDTVKAKKRSSKQVNISFDEFNTWHTLGSIGRFDYRWQTAAPILEDTYTQLDAVVLGMMFMAILRHCDRVEIACVSELCNCISQIRTRNGGGVWVFPPYYTWLTFSQYARGTSIMPVVKESPKYDSTNYTDVPYLDVAAVSGDEDEGWLNIFAVNRCKEESLPLEMVLRGFEDLQIIEHIVLESEHSEDTNSEENPDNVRPHSNGDASLDSNILSAVLPKLSWNIIRMKCK